MMAACPTAARGDSESHGLRTGVLAALALLLAGCSLKAGLQKAVLMDYDQVANFRTYTYQDPVVWIAGTSEPGVNGYAPVPNRPDIRGFWVTYVICNLRNAGSNAGTFHYDVNKFYVEYEGKQFFHGVLEPYTFTSWTNGLPANPQITPALNAKLRKETQIGNDEVTYQPSATTYDGNPHRFVIYVTKSVPGPVDIEDLRLPLRYDGYPNVLNPRNQKPATFTSTNPAAANDLRNACRPQLQ